MALLLTLQQRRRATAAELAETLEVSVRTIYRDIAALQQAGVPLWTEPGPHGGIRLLDGWRTRLDGLTAQEAAALFLAGAPAALADLGLGTVLAAAQAKVLATLPPELRRHAARIRQRFHLDAPGWFHHPEELPHLGTVAQALWDQRRIRIHYRRGDQEEVARLLDPLGLVLKAGIWYLVGRVADHPSDTEARHARPASIRTYRIARLTAATPTDQYFDWPTDFDLEQWWARSSADFDRSILRERVRLRLSPRGRWLLPHLTSHTAATEALAAAGPADAEGWQEVELAVESHLVALTQLVGLGAEVEILDPPKLRAEFAAIGTAMARRNAGTPTAPATGS